jgi:hypothetical protein
MINRKALVRAALGLALIVGAANAEVYVRVGPPAPVREVVPARPGPRYVWVSGFYRWDGRRYLWAPGYWVLPPRPVYSAWVPGHWRGTHHGWVWVEGHWR